jgi:hypothetical protein
MGKAGALTLQVAATTIGNDLGAFLHDILLGLGCAWIPQKNPEKPLAQPFRVTFAISFPGALPCSVLHQVFWLSDHLNPCGLP